LIVKLITDSKRLWCSNIWIRRRRLCDKCLYISIKTISLPCTTYYLPWNSVDGVYPPSLQLWKGSTVLVYL